MRTDMDDAPNARTVGYGHVQGDHLKVRWAARRDPDKSWIEFSPADLQVELNGVPLTTCTGVSLDFAVGEKLPHARLSFNLESLDIDADTMTALEAFVKQQGV